MRLPSAGSFATRDADTASHRPLSFSPGRGRHAAVHRRVALLRRSATYWDWRSRADQFCREYQNQIHDWMRMMQDINRAHVRCHYAEADRDRVSFRLCGRVIADRGEALVLHLYASHNDEWRAAMPR